MDVPERGGGEDQVGDRVPKTGGAPGQQVVDRVHPRDGRGGGGAGGNPPRDREPAEPDREDEFEYESKPEDRDVISNRTVEARGEIRESIPTRSGERAEPNAEDARNEHGRKSQFDRRGHPA